ncbi:MAG: hypothetical protein KAV41_02255 [Candidatus Pacebacteria bacterium]|nr:hypothetical protein [Candidatus Paceibacterota bacterium]
MNSQEFTNLYTKQNLDETITSFENEVGFSLIRLYPKDTPYHKDSKRMFIKIAILNRGFFYGVDMTKPEKRGETTSYVIIDGEKYQKKVTNFFSDNDGNEFIFDEALKKIKHGKTNKSFTLNEFIEILVNNHLSDMLFWKRKVNALINIILKILFWFSDKHYEKVQVSIDKYNFSRENKSIMEEQNNAEPFFKYFFISKNFIFSILLVTFLIASLSAVFPDKIPLKYIWNSLFGEFSLSNPLVILLFFLALFSSEKLSIWLNKNIKDFLMPEKDYFSKQKETFIEKLHNYQYHNKFKLKLNTQVNKKN